MRSLRLSIIALQAIIYTSSFAQNIGINSTGATPNPAAILDLQSGNAGTKGFLPEQVALTATNAVGPVASPPTGLIVYNTATAGVSPNNVVPGYYFNAGTPATPNWEQFVAGNSATTTVGAWLLNGNTSTNAASNFLGTTDATTLNFRTNNAQRMTILSTGQVGVGTAAPAAMFDVNSPLGTPAVYGHSPNTAAYIAYETPFSFGTPIQTVSGAGIYSANPLSGYTSMYSQSTGAANVAADINFSSVWIANYSYVQNPGPFNPPAVYAQLNNSTSLSNVESSAIVGLNDYGTTAVGAGSISVGVEGVSASQFQNAFGVDGESYCDVTASAPYSFGGTFSGNDYSTGTNYSTVYVGGNFNGTIYKISGTGTVAEVIPTPTHGRVTLDCPESPEYWYQDYSSAKMVNGKVHVDLDPILADIIIVNDSNPIRVFCTPVNMPYFNGVTIMNQTATSFDIIELNGGNHSGRIDYQLVAKPKTNYGTGRFAWGPGPAMAPKDIPASIPKNKPDPSKIWYWPSDAQTYHYVLPKPQPKTATRSQDIQNK